jgi:hypothetical protein
MSSKLNGLSLRSTELLIEALCNLECITPEDQENKDYLLMQLKQILQYLSEQ